MWNQTLNSLASGCFRGFS